MEEVRREDVGVDEYDRMQATARDAIRKTDNFAALVQDGERIKVIVMVTPDVERAFAEAMIETGQRILDAR